MIKVNIHNYLLLRLTILFKVTHYLKKNMKIFLHPVNNLLRTDKQGTNFIFSFFFEPSFFL